MSYGPGPSHVQLELSQPIFRELYENLARHVQLIRYDVRNSGLSDHHVEAAGFDEQYADMLAVVEASGVDRLALYMRFGGTKFALRFAAEQPERTTALILGAPDLGRTQRSVRGNLGSLLRPLLDVSWEAYVDALMAVTVGLDAEMVAEGARLQKEGIGPHDFRRMGRAVDEADAQRWFAAVRCPTLVMHFDSPVYSIDVARSIVGQVDGARLSIVRGASQPVHPAADAEALAFLANLALDDEPPAFSGFQTILFTDLESSTELTRSLGDEQAQEVLHGHNNAVRKALVAHDGAEVKHTGDGIMASFPSAVSAVTAALEIQRDLHGGEVRVRIGLNAGEPIAEDGDLFGLSVIKASRIADRADPGQVLASNVVKELCEGKRFTFTSIGEVNLKGFDEAVAVYNVELG
jgi:class 3 adenylate cyclase